MRANRNPMRTLVRLGFSAAFGLSIAALQGCTYYTMSERPIVAEQVGDKSSMASLAIMPVVNATKKEGLDAMIRRGLYSYLSTLHYRDVELGAVDEAVAAKSLELNLPPREIPPEAFQGADLADGLLYAEVTRVSKFWFLVYSHIKLGVSLKLVDTDSLAVRYTSQATLHKRRLTIPTSIGGLVESFVLTLWHVRDSELESASDEFGKRISKSFPQPQCAADGEIGIDAVFVAAPEPVLRAGSVLKVEVRGTPGQTGTFDIGDSITSLPLVEESPGVYVGTYGVVPGDLCETGVVRAHLTPLSGQTVTMSNLQERFRIDALPPPQPDIQKVVLGQSELTLHLGLPRPGPGMVFEIYRAELPDRGYFFQDRAEKPIWTDRSIRPDRRYSYLVKAVDRDGRLSQISEPRDVQVPAKGPTRLPEVLRGHVALHLYSSPYLVSSNCTLPADSSLRVEPGVEIRVAAGARFSLVGPAAFEGTAKQPVRLLGESDSTLLHFEPASPDVSLRLDSVMMRKARVGLEAKGGQVTVETGRFEDLDAAVRLDAAREARFSRCWFKGVGVAIEGSASRLAAEFCLFDNLPRGISAYAPELLLAGNDFTGSGLAISQLSPAQTSVDNNYFDTSDPLVLLRRVQGPCVFKRIYGGPSASRSSFTPFPGDYETYQKLGDQFHAEKAYESALRSYFPAWWLKKERGVGLRLVGILQRSMRFGDLLRQDKQLHELFQRGRRSEAAMFVSRTLAVMYPEDKEILLQYAGLLEKNGYRTQARQIRERAEAEPASKLPVPDIGGQIEKIRESVRDFIVP